MSRDSPNPEPITQSQFLIGAGLFEGGLLVVALVLGRLVGTDATAQLYWSWRDFGLGLLATSSFAPGSIRRLGAAFLLAGGAGFAWLAFAAAPPSPAAACAFMGATFGGFHLVYGLLTRGTRAEPAP